MKHEIGNEVLRRVVARVSRLLGFDRATLCSPHTPIHLVWLAYLRRSTYTLRRASSVPIRIIWH